MSPLHRICATHGCNQLVPLAARRCPQHQTEWQHTRNTKPQRWVYNDKRWRTTRRHTLEAAGFQCTLCGETATIADHNPPLTTLLTRGDDPFSQHYLRALCAKCSGRVDGARSHHPTPKGGVGWSSRPAKTLQPPASNLLPDMAGVEGPPFLVA